MNEQTQKELDAFLAVSDQFKLGTLSTESSHPLTGDLSQLSQTDVSLAASLLKQVDVMALKRLCEYAPRVAELAEAIASVLKNGSKVFLCGCGATGRLSVSLEVLARQGLMPSEYRDKVIGFMAGGDCALIKAIERFEDYPEYGARQLQEMGYTPEDLLIAITEGGETPFVIGAAEYAAEHGLVDPWFVYCNEDSVLSKTVERSRRVIEDFRIEKLNLSVGPMALSGSTRMQATTVQMAAVGFAIFFRNDVRSWFASLLELVESSDYSQLVPFVESESREYQRENYVLYRTKNHGITVLTDTTERAPTFSLVPFENIADTGSRPSLSYLCIDGGKDAQAAWRILLQREPRCIEWDEFRSFAGKDYFMGFDISEKGAEVRINRLSHGEVRTFEVDGLRQNICFNFMGMKADWGIGSADLLQQHLLLKMLLNTHSTLVMGRLHRYEGNVMTWVKSSNNKLIDRAIRYVRDLWIRDTQTTVDYAIVAKALFEEREKLPVSESIVIRTLERLKREVNRG